MTVPLPPVACVLPFPALPPTTEEACVIAARYVTVESVPGGHRIAYRPPGTAPEGPDLLYRIVRDHELFAAHDRLVALLAPLVDVALARGWAKHDRPTCGPDGPGDALVHRHEPPRLGGMDVTVGDEEGEVE